MLELEDLTNSVIGAAIKVQSSVGPGLLESAYRICLAHELALRGHQVAQEAPLEVHYEGLVLPQAYRMDLVVDGQLVLELKTVERLSPAHEAQLLTYLRFSGKRVGLLFNFWSWPLKDGGIKRLIHTP
ncbi:MAG: GxxExxY protein [Acidobacteria bacterium]|nr:GxxExxY protein [Acidobacteriota bacterium]